MYKKKHILKKENKDKEHIHLELVLLLMSRNMENNLFNIEKIE